MKAILIARVSTEDQREAGNSLPAQMVRLENYCNNKGFKIAKSYSFDESAYTDQRDEFDQIIQFIVSQDEKIAVCCDKVDRLSRNIFDKRISVLYEKALNDNIELHFVSEGQVISSRISAVEKFQFGISLGLAKYYSDAISDNVKRALEQKRRKGECTSKAPYGYKNIRHDNGKADVVVDEYASHVVQKTFALYASGAYSLDLLREKLKKDYGIKWGKSYLDAVLNNHFYYGVMVVKEKMYQHKYPPLITQSLFEQVQQMKAGFNKKRFKYAGKPYLYRGLLRCAECGLSITPEKHKGHVYYHCTQYNGKHNAQWLREEEITRQLGDIFKRLQVPQDIVHQIVDTLREVHTNKVEFQHKHHSELVKDQKSLTSMMDNLYFDKLKGRIADSDYDRFYQTLRDQITDVNVRLDQLQEAEDNYYITAKYVLELANRAYDLFMSSEVEQKRQLVKLILSNARVEGKNVVYEAHKPFDMMIKMADDPVWCAQ